MGDRKRLIGTCLTEKMYIFVPMWKCGVRLSEYEFPPLRQRDPEYRALNREVKATLRLNLVDAYHPFFQPKVSTHFSFSSHFCTLLPTCLSCLMTVLFFFSTSEMPSPLILVIQLFSALLRLTASLELSLVPSVPTDVFLLRNSHHL